MDCLKSFNICVNTLVLPGSLAKSSYLPNDHPYNGEIDGLKLLFIPIDDEVFSYIGCSSYPKYIPVLLNMASANAGSIFCIHFHGNACDVGEVGACAVSESYTYMAHYLVVEYPKFGIAKGFPCEAVINSIARSVYRFVINELKVPPERIVLIGRSIGTGPACSLASYLQSENNPPAALILHAPYTSLRDAAYDLLGCFSFLFLNRWENWTKICKVKNYKYTALSFKDQDDTDVPMQSPCNQNPLLSSGILISSPLPQKVLSKGNCEEYIDPTSRTVVKCPVLFIHADKDLIIDCHHSQMMHDHRIAAGLPSVLFIQQSVEGFNKGHNYFDYNKEVVTPCRDFLQQYVPNATPHKLDLDTLRRVCKVPIGFNPPTPSSFSRARDENNISKNKVDRNYQMERDKIGSKEVKGGGAVCVADCDSANNVCRWALCPCVFCCEASLACLSTAVSSLMHTVTCSTPAFMYETKKARRKDHINGCKVVKAFLCFQSLENFIREEEPAEEDSDDDEGIDPATFNPLQSFTPQDKGEKEVGNNNTDKHCKEVYQKLHREDSDVRTPTVVTHTGASKENCFHRKNGSKEVDTGCGGGGVKYRDGTPKPKRGLSGKSNSWHDDDTQTV